MATPGAIRKAENDKERLRQGKHQRSRLHVKNNPTKLAFRGWEDVPDPWTFDHAKQYIEWCHIDKSFQPERHHYHLRNNKANLKYCTNPEFLSRCLQINQVLYNTKLPNKNVVGLFLARGVHVEIILRKRFDWSTLKGLEGKCTPPRAENGFPGFGVWVVGDPGWFPLANEPSPEIYWPDSPYDSDSDGTHEIVLPGPRTQEKHKRKRQALSQQPIPVAPLAPIGHQAPQQLVPNIVEEEMGQAVGDDMVMEQPIGGGEEPDEVVGGGMELQEMPQIQQLMEENQRLKEENQRLHEEARRDRDTISAHQQRIQELEATMAKGKGPCTSITRPGTSTSPRGLVIGSPPDSLSFEHPDYNQVLGVVATAVEVDLLDV